MSTTKELDSLIERLKNDASDYEGTDPHSWGIDTYLQKLLDSENLVNKAAIGSSKKAISDGINTLSQAQIKAIAIDILKNDMYLEKCPNEWCGEKISWEDMYWAVYENKCVNCQNN